MFYRFTSLTVIIVLLTGAVSAQDESNATVEDVENFNFNSELAKYLRIGASTNFFRLDEQQKLLIESIKSESEQDAESVLGDLSLNPDEKSNRLTELRNRQAKRLYKLLRPEQEKRVPALMSYLVLMKEGFVNSMIDGMLASRLKLSIQQRKDVRDRAETVYEELKNDLLVAQKNAIAKMRESLPADQRGAFDEIIEPLLREDGTLSDRIDAMFDPTRRRPTSFYPPLPRLSDK